MAKWILKEVSQSMSVITLGKKEVGKIWKSGNKVYGRLLGPVALKDINKESETLTFHEMYVELCSAYNRISLCGEDNKEAAEKALAEHNQKIVLQAIKQNEESDRFMRESGLGKYAEELLSKNDEFSDITRKLISSVLAPKVRVRKTKIRI